LGVALILKSLFVGKKEEREAGKTGLKDSGDGMDTNDK